MTWALVKIFIVLFIGLVRTTVIIWWAQVHAHMERIRQYAFTKDIIFMRGLSVSRIVTQLVRNPILGSLLHHDKCTSDTSIFTVCHTWAVFTADDKLLGAIELTAH